MEEEIECGEPLSVDEEPSSAADDDDVDDEPVENLIEEVPREEIERESNGVAANEDAVSDEELDELLDGMLMQSISK